MRLSSRPPPSSQSHVIRASDIGQYAFCPRAWWLGSVMGVASANVRELAQGEAAHQQHGRTVWAAQTLRVLAIGLVVLAVVVLLASL